MLGVLIPGESGCPAIVDGHMPCGLLWQHRGDCAPFVPGDYLPPPILHPLDWTTRPTCWVCPLCGGRLAWVDENWSVWVYRDARQWIQALTFHPCGCVGRVAP